MQLMEINIRDPFVLPYDGAYYLYGTRGATCWGECNGFDVYVSRDLIEWSEPMEAFHKPEGFWADRNYWAPEIHYYRDKFYAFVSFKSPERCRGTQILVSDTPTGPYLVHSDGPVTPSDWECLDGTFYVDHEGQPYMVFSHEWVQVNDGQICAVKLSPDLRKAISEPEILFTASESPWPCAIRNGPNYVTDGPFVYQPDNPFRNHYAGNPSLVDHSSDTRPLLMLWSSLSVGGEYVQILAVSDNGSILGPWRHDTELLYRSDGGHGMIFRTFDNRLYLTLHTPNEHLKERPVFLPLEDSNGLLKVL